MFVKFVIAMVVAVLAILVAVILGDYGPWYLSWVLGTGFMILVAASAGVFFEAQEDAANGTGTDAAKILGGPLGGPAGGPKTASIAAAAKPARPRGGAKR